MRSFPFPNPFLFFFSSSASPSSGKTLPFISPGPHPTPPLPRAWAIPPSSKKRAPTSRFPPVPSDACATTDTSFTKGSTSIPSSGTPVAGPKTTYFPPWSGIVRHLNATSGYSAYGKYLVLEHTTLNPPLYSLYAHLASIQPGLKIGSKVQVAQVLGKMGNTASYSIPLNRSHLHFEIGLRLTDHFQSWYDKKKYTTKNRHGNFSGFNLVGIDPLPFIPSTKRNPSPPRSSTCAPCPSQPRYASVQTARQISSDATPLSAKLPPKDQA